MNEQNKKQKTIKERENNYSRIYFFREPLPRNAYKEKLLKKSWELYKNSRDLKNNSQIYKNCKEIFRNPEYLKQLNYSKDGNKESGTKKIAIDRIAEMIRFNSARKNNFTKTELNHLKDLHDLLDETENKNK